MIVNVIGLVIGILILVGALYYLVHEKEDQDSRKIYGIGVLIGLIIVVVTAVRMLL